MRQNKFHAIIKFSFVSRFDLSHNFYIISNHFRDDNDFYVINYISFVIQTNYQSTIIIYEFVAKHKQIIIVMNLKNKNKNKNRIVKIVFSSDDQIIIFKKRGTKITKKMFFQNLILT